ncbi:MULTISPECIES: amidohydrolase family protein [Acinetobacter]|uniref:6-methylsalicylate decarboxylase n=1 Tax=Acinetobacter higginsii TaxID=70347 RepID=N9STL5_9GAMM|nr:MULTISPECIES: amidohydrolase family protein [Acinetobacter]ENX58001.1 hypothetical protein F902_02401 [Acinetobacter higginsii]
MKNFNRIDVHQHLIPSFWKNALIKQGGDPSGWRIPDWSPESALKFMDDNDIQTGVLSLSAPSVMSWEGKEASDMGRHVNEYIAELVQKNPSRFGHFITVPLPDIDASLNEIKYGFDELNADGVVLFSNYHGLYLGDESLEPVWKELDSRHAVVFIHPSKSIDPLTGLPSPLIDYPFDTTRTAVHMVANGILRKYRNVKVILSHAGGFLPFIANRVAELYPTLNASVTKNEILDDLRQFYFDTALSSGHVALQTLLSFAQQDHILYGSDFPHASVPVSSSFARDLDSYPNYQGTQQADINRENALKLFKRLR